VREHLENSIATALKSFLAHKDDQTISIATSLLLNRGMDALEPQLVSMLAAETEQLRCYSIQLFPDTKAPKDHGDTSAWQAVVCGLETLLLTLQSTESDFSAIMPLLRPVIDALRYISNQQRARIPSDKELRPFFESILVLDTRFSEPIINWCTRSHSPTTKNEWSVLSQFLQLAVEIKGRSRYGPKSLEKLLRSEGLLASIIKLGVLACDSDEDLVVILFGMIERRLVKTFNLEGALLTVIADDPNTTDMANKLHDLITAKYQGSAVRMKRLAVVINNNEEHGKKQP
jgi:hypothetical protein